MVLRIKLDELRARNSGGENVSFRNRNDVVVARVQHQRRRPHLSEQLRDVDHRPRLEQSRGDLRRRGLAAEIVEPADLFVGRARDEPRSEDLTEGRIITAPSETSEIDHRPVQALPVGIAAAKRPAGIAAVEDEM